MTRRRGRSSTPLSRARRRRRGTGVDPTARRPAPVARGALGPSSRPSCSPGGVSSSNGLAERDPVVLVFEDMQWADAPLLEFVAYLLEWSRNHAILVVALARPGSAEDKAQWAAGLRNATTLSLEPLSTEAMEALLDGFVPGLPDDLRTRILERSEGVPLYAVETVRMLIDRGLLEQVGRRVPTHRPDRGARSTRDPAGADRRSPGRPAGRGAPWSRTPRCWARLQQVRARGGVGRGRRRPRRLLDGARAEGGPLAPGGSPLARAWAVQLPPGPPAPGGVRDALAQRAQGEASGGGRLTSSSNGRTATTSSWRSLPRTCPVGARARSRGSRRTRAAESALRPARPRGGASRVLGASESAQRYFEQALELSESPLRAPSSTSVQARWRLAALRARAVRTTSRRRSRGSRSIGLTHPAARVRSPARIAHLAARGRYREGDRATWSARSTVLAADERDADLAQLAV